MSSSRRTFSREFKIDAIRRLNAGASVVEVARACDIHPNVLRSWRRDFVKAPESAFPGAGRSPEKGRIAELRRQVQQQAQEIDNLKERARRNEKASGTSE